MSTIWKDKLEWIKIKTSNFQQNCEVKMKNEDFFSIGGRIFHLRMQKFNQ